MCLSNIRSLIPCIHSRRLRTRTYVYCGIWDAIAGKKKETVKGPEHSQLKGDEWQRNLRILWKKEGKGCERKTFFARKDRFFSAHAGLHYKYIRLRPAKSYCIIISY